MSKHLPLIFDIKRHSLEDGPGIRTVVFFKGCPLHCLWCHNPEAIDAGNEIGFYPSGCIDCGSCVESCPSGALKLNPHPQIDRALCRRCGSCVDACPGRGLRHVGRHYEIDELLDIILRDKIYYRTSGGGVTLSGGEPTLHMDYASELLRQLKQHGIHTTIETCGTFDYPDFKAKLSDHLDLILFDVKLADEELHRRYTGKENKGILDNLGNLAESRHDDIIPRVPLIPGITAEPENLQRIKALLRETGLSRCWLLPYNPLGFSKLAALGKPAADLPERRLTEEELSRIEDIFSGMDLVEL